MYLSLHICALKKIPRMYYTRIETIRYYRKNHSSDGFIFVEFAGICIHSSFIQGPQSKARACQAPAMGTGSQCLTCWRATAKVSSGQ